MRCLGVLLLIGCASVPVDRSFIGQPLDKLTAVWGGDMHRTVRPDSSMVLYYDMLQNGTHCQVSVTVSKARIIEQMSACR